jgi:DNA-binding MarR family transcriptional regulator
VVQQADSFRLEAALAIVRQATARLASLSERFSPGGGGTALGAVAERLYSDRRRRDEQFPPGLFGEPAWDLLLALFVAREDGRELGLAEAYAAAKVDPRDGPALIDKLVTVGMVLRNRAPQDGRRETVALTDEAADLLSDYLTDTI